MRPSEFFWKALRRVIHATGLVRVILLSKKGRITQYVERIEPQIRMKQSLNRCVPPWIVALDPVGSPSDALRDHFGQSIFFVNSASSELTQAVVGHLAYPKKRWLEWFEKCKSVQWRRVWDLPKSRSPTGSWEVDTERLLDKFGLPTEARIVLLSVRDSRYYENLDRRNPLASPGPAVPESRVVNPDIDSYLEACYELRRLGYYVIRIGRDQTPLSQKWQDIALDYATTAWDPRSDLLLAHRAEFLLNGASGAWALTSLFNRPVLSTNCYFPFRSSAYSSASIFSHQLQRDLRTGELRSFRAMLLSGGSPSDRTVLPNDSMTLVKHSPVEIREMCQEMVARRNGTFVEAESDRRRRQRFESIRIASAEFYELGQISTVFLRRYEHLLD